MAVQSLTCKTLQKGKQNNRHSSLLKGFKFGWGPDLRPTSTILFCKALQ